MEQTLPRYFLAHALPDGDQRYAYPSRFMPGGDSTQRGYRAHDADDSWTWTYLGEHGAEVDVVRSGSWFVARERLAEVSRRRPGGQVRVADAGVPEGWVKSPQASDPDGVPVMPELHAEHADLPAQPSQEAVTHWQEHQAPHACWPCRRFQVHYQPAWGIGPDVVESRDLSDVTELRAPMPPAIDPGAWRYQPKGQESSHWSSAATKPADPTWWVDDTSRTALYGPHTAHLWPGRLTGFRSAVTAALAAHPLVDRVEDRTESNSQHFVRAVHVTIRVPWETHQVRESWEKRTQRSRKRERQVLTDVWAVRHDVVVSIPEALEAPTLQEALDRWDTAVEEQLDRVFPFGQDAAACDHCDGTGVTRQSGQRTILKGQR